MIGIIDYGMGNLASVQNALHKLHVDSLISSDPAVLETCDKLILPGVGAFGDCMNNINERGLFEPITEMVHAKKPLLGICLGMQMLFEESEEKGITEGFGFLEGKVVEMQTELPIPEIGWNELVFTEQGKEIKTMLSEHPYVYYVHSYIASAYRKEDLIAYSEYGDVIVPGIVGKGNVLGCQFHPEKSSSDGLKILKWYAEEFK